MQNKVVVHHADGSISKGFTNDFMPNKDLFHLMPMDAQAGIKPIAIEVHRLKAIFFVKDFKGNRQYREKKVFDSKKPAMGRKIKVVFRDGEILIGTTQGYEPGRPGFFVIQADSLSNNDRCFIVTSATREVSFI
jgi:hypothetical protein